VNTIIPKIKCPRCNSFNLHKTGKDHNGHLIHQIHQLAKYSDRTYSGIIEHIPG